MAVPDRSTARQLLGAAQPPDWLVVHSEGVARIAVAAADVLAAGGVAVDRDLVEAAAILHDVDKLETRGSERHGLAAAERLTALGYGELAGPVASHPFYRLEDPELAPRGWEAICVSVADRRVGQGFTTIRQRLDDLAARYPEHRDDIDRARAPADALEARMAEAAGVSREELEGRLAAAWAADGQ